jgi:hypothetical protein
MPKYVVNQAVAAPSDAIWPVLTDVLRWPEWTPTVTSVVPVDGHAFEVGSRFRIEQPRLRPAIWTVTSISPREGFEWETTAPGLRMIAAHRLAPEAPGTTQLELSFSFAGLFGPLFGLLFRGLTLRYMSTEASKLKATVEASLSAKKSVV